LQSSEFASKFESLFHKFDFDNSGTMNSEDELSKLTTSLVFHLELHCYIGPEDIDTAVANAVAATPGGMEENNWDVEQTRQWFITSFAGKLPAQEVGSGSGSGSGSGQLKARKPMSEAEKTRFRASLMKRVKSFGPGDVPDAEAPKPLQLPEPVVGDRVVLAAGIEEMEGLKAGVVATVAVVKDRDVSGCWKKGDIIVKEVVSGEQRKYFRAEQLVLSTTGEAKLADVGTVLPPPSLVRPEATPHTPQCELARKPA
jgi:hypothetical protein